MLEDPRCDHQELADALRAAYGVDAADFTFVPGGIVETAEPVVVG